jgi:hypothetical protein
MLGVVDDLDPHDRRQCHSERSVLCQYLLHEREVQNQVGAFFPQIRHDDPPITLNGRHDTTAHGHDEDLTHRGSDADMGPSRHTSPWVYQRTHLFFRFS